MDKRVIERFVDRPLQGGVKFNPQLRETLRACVDEAYKTMTGAIFSGKRLNWLFDQRFFFVRSIRNDLKRVACTDQADYSLNLPENKVAALAWLVASHLAAEAGVARQAGRSLPGRYRPVVRDLSRTSDSRS